MITLPIIGMCKYITMFCNTLDVESLIDSSFLLLCPQVYIYALWHFWIIQFFN